MLAGHQVLVNGATVVDLADQRIGLELLGRGRADGRKGQGLEESRLHDVRARRLRVRRMWLDACSETSVSLERRSEGGVHCDSPLLRHSIVYRPRGAFATRNAANPMTSDYDSGDTTRRLLEVEGLQCDVTWGSHRDHGAIRPASPE